MATHTPGLCNISRKVRFLTMVDFGDILHAWEQSPAGQKQQHTRSRDEGGDGQSEPRHGPSPRRLPIDATLDLHGHTREAALAAVEQFVSDGLQARHRKLLVVHGKGESSGGILRTEVRRFLERHDRVGAMGYADGPNGGRGALWFVLRET